MPRTALSLTNLGLFSYYSNFYSAPTTNISTDTILGTNTYPTLSPGTVWEIGEHQVGIFFI